MQEHNPLEGKIEKTISLPRSFKVDTDNLYALPYESAGCLWLPENVKTLIVDSAVELQCHDLVVTFYTGKQNTYFINKLAMGVSERKFWGKPTGNSNCGSIAMFESHDDSDEMTGVKTESLRHMHKIVGYIDDEGVTHTVTEALARVEMECGQ